MESGFRYRRRLVLCAESARKKWLMLDVVFQILREVEVDAGGEKESLLSKGSSKKLTVPCVAAYCHCEVLLSPLLCSKVFGSSSHLFHSWVWAFPFFLITDFSPTSPCLIRPLRAICAFCFAVELHLSLELGLRSPSYSGL